MAVKPLSGLIHSVQLPPAVDAAVLLRKMDGCLVRCNNAATYGVDNEECTQQRCY